MAQRTYLQVPFPEKDQAKALGARWDPLERKWYIQADDLTPFRRWIALQGPDTTAVPSFQGTGETPAAYQSSPHAAQGVSLLDFMRRVQSTVEAVFAQPVWVRVEINQARQSQGHWFLELVEHDATGTVVAQTSGILWKNHLGMLQKFQQETGVMLSEGIKLLLAVQPRFNPRYGLKLDILGMDSAFTLGDMAAKLNRIRDTLKQEGVYLRNKRLALPHDFTHLAVISPSGAASLGDFRAEADRLEQLGLCHFTYYETLFQGPGAAAAIRQALQRAQTLHQHKAVDAVIIIRGGGAASDLFWLNDEDLAREVCLCPLPVITGIGHEPDNTILDEVAARRCDTPSKVAQLLLTTIAGATAQAEACMQIIRDLAGRRLQQAGHEAERHWEQTRAQAAQGLEHRLTRVEQDHREIVATARLTVLRRQDRLDFLMLSCREAGVRHAQSALNTLEQPWRQIRELGAQRLRTAATQCEQLIQVIIALGPEKTLRRGYGVLRTGGRVITSRSAIAPGDEFSVEMQDGVMTARRLT